jgi:hypothetical protein
VAFERDGEPLPRLGGLGAGGGALAEHLAHVRGRVQRGARCLALDLGPTTLLVVGFGGEAGGDRVGVALKPLLWMAAGGVQAGELELDALDVRPAAVDLATQIRGAVEQASALRALAPAESVCLFGELVGALALLRRKAAVLAELVLQPQCARGGAGVETASVLKNPPGDSGPHPAGDPVRVLLADRAGSARRAVAAILDQIDGTVLVGVVGSREDVPNALRRLRADVLVIDDRLLPSDDHPLAAAGPLPTSVRVIVLGMDDHPTFAERALRLGADAWAAKHTADERLRELLGSTPTTGAGIRDEPRRPGRL